VSSNYQPSPPAPALQNPRQVRLESSCRRKFGVLNCGELSWNLLCQRQMINLRHTAQEDILLTGVREGCALGMRVIQVERMTSGTSCSPNLRIISCSLAHDSWRPHRASANQRTNGVNWAPARRGVYLRGRAAGTNRAQNGRRQLDD
jgi:hypothetical protein